MIMSLFLLESLTFNYLCLHLFVMKWNASQISVHLYLRHMTEI